MNVPLDNPSNTETLASKVRHLRTEIAAHPFAKGLSQGQVNLLADCAMDTRFEPGEVIFLEGDFANRFYFLLDGEVALESRAKSNSVVIGSIGGGDVLGWSWLFAPYHWNFTARAAKPTRAIFFYGTWLREACEQDHDLGYELGKRMAEAVVGRLQATRLQLAQILSDNLQTNNTTPGLAGEPTAEPII